MPDPILDIQELTPERETVRIFGVSYELRRVDDFSLEDRRLTNQLWKRIQELEQSGGTDADDLEYRDATLRLARHVLPDAPPDVIEKVGLSAQGAIITAFFVKSSDPRVQLIARILSEQGRASTGDTPSPDSNGSIMAIPNGGSNFQSGI